MLFEQLISLVYAGGGSDRLSNKLAVDSYNWYRPENTDAMSDNSAKSIN